MDKNLLKPRYLTVKEHLQERLGNGSLSPGDKIRPLELTRQFQVSTITVERALRELTEEGYLRREKGTGTVVIPRRGAGGGVAYVMMCSEGHFWGGLYAEIVRGLATQGLHVLTYPAEGAALESRWEEALSFGGEVMVAAARGNFPFHLLGRGQRPRRLVFCPFYESALEFPDTAKVLVDYFAVGYLSAGHLLDRGYKHLVFWAVPDSGMTHSLGARMAGIRKAMAERGASSLTLQDNLPATASPAELDKAVAALSRRSGLIFLYDFLATGVIASCKRLGLSIPGDLGLVGCFNTPWTAHLQPTLTSVSLREEKLAEEVCRRVRDGVSGETLVTPELVIRGST